MANHNKVDFILYVLKLVSVAVPVSFSIAWLLGPHILGASPIS